MARKYNKDIKDHQEYLGELHVYTTMKHRCYSKKNKSYGAYGGRGIKVCDRWLGKDGFQNFYDDMGARPYEKNGRPYQIDRIDPNGDYCPENCRWLSVAKNQRNRRNNVYLILWGDKVCVSEACRMLNIKLSTVKESIRLRKMSPEDAVIHGLKLMYKEKIHA